MIEKQNCLVLKDSIFPSSEYFAIILLIKFLSLISVPKNSKNIFLILLSFPSLYPNLVKFSLKDFLSSLSDLFSLQNQSNFLSNGFSFY